MSSIRDVLGDGRGRVLVGKALGTALEQVEIGSVVGELDIHRGPERLFEDLEDVADVFDERGRVDQPAKVRNQLVPFGVDQQPHRFVQHVVLEHRKDLLERGIFGAVGLQQLIELMSLEGVGLEVDDIH